MKKSAGVAPGLHSEVAEEAIIWGADLVLTHHPLFFSSGTAHGILGTRNGGGLHAAEKRNRSVFGAYQSGCGARGGVNETLCELLGIQDAIPIDEGVGRAGKLKEAETLGGFGADRDVARARASIVGSLDAPVRHVAVLGGSGASAMARDCRGGGCAADRRG
ncbi:MAG: Nif3-like dinuclear metal center hexameric protein [Eubacteriales bacterium]